MQPFKEPEKIDYEVVEAGFIAGRRRAAGEPISMSETEAKFLLLDGRIREPAKKAAPKKAAD
jgi:hypothetical protein